MDILRILNTSVLVVALSGALATVVFVSQPLLPFGSGYGRDFEGAEASTLRESVRTLSSLDRAGAEGAAHTADHIVGELARLGIGTGGTWTGATVTRQEFRADGETFANVVVNIPSTVSTSEPKRMIIWAHYDTDGDAPGADDNASGVAGLLELARVLRDVAVPTRTGGVAHASLPDRDIELVFYANEEMPYFGTEQMGSYAHAASIADPGSVELVVVLEMIGYFSQAPDSQDFPIRGMRYVYPTVGNFTALVSDTDHVSEIRSAKAIFRSVLAERGLIDVRSINAPNSVTGVDFSDHRNYWIFGMPAIMVTDTAFYRNRAYHTAEDTYDRLDYDRMAEVVDAVAAVALRY